MDKYQISKEDLITYLNHGLSSRDIEKITGIRYWDILYYIQQYGIKEYNHYSKKDYNIHFFDKVDTKEKAYILGLFLGDGHITKDNKFEMNIQRCDEEILKFVDKNIGCGYRIDNRKNEAKKKFPQCSIKLCDQVFVRNLKRLFGGRLKAERHIPIIKKDLERYMVLGFFDAKGCVTWGWRKDRNKIWQKISFTSQYQMLVGIQNILDKNGISSRLRPKSKEQCYIIEICDKNRVLQFLDYIYPNDEFIVLKRKYEKQYALRLELGEFGESLVG